MEGQFRHMIAITALIIVVLVNLGQIDGSTKANQIKCGQSVGSKLFNDGNGNRITYGHQALPGAIPFQASLLILDREYFVRHCGGVIIDRQTILTAAHCVVENGMTSPKENIKIFVGEHVRSVSDGEKMLEVAKIIVHNRFEKFNRKTKLIEFGVANDIAMIKTIQKMSWDLTEDGYGSVNRVCLPTIDDLDYEDGQMVYISGWGMNESSIESDVLNIVERPIVDRDVCSKHWLNIQADHVCVSNENSTGWWHGDSGGPIFHLAGNGQQAILVGLNSFGHDKPLGKVSLPPRVGTRVSHYLNWTRDNCPECVFN